MKDDDALGQEPQEKSYWRRHPVATGLRYSIPFVALGLALILGERPPKEVQPAFKQADEEDTAVIKKGCSPDVLNSQLTIRSPMGESATYYPFRSVQNWSELCAEEGLTYNELSRTSSDKFGGLPGEVDFELSFKKNPYKVFVNNFDRTKFVSNHALKSSVRNGQREGDKLEVLVIYHDPREDDYLREAEMYSIDLLDAYRWISRYTLIEEKQKSPRSIPKSSTETQRAI